MGPHHLLLIPVLLLAACATPGPQRPLPEIAPQAAEPDPLAEVMYHLLVGEIAGNQGDVTMAARSYVDAANLSTDPQVAARATQIALYAENLELAQRAARRWQELAPDAADPYRTLGLLALNRGELEQAVEQFDASLARRGSSGGFAGLAALLNRQTRPEDALRVMERLAALHPEDRAAHYAVAQVALQAERPQLAVQALDQALALDPQWQAARMLRIEAQLRAGHPEAALQALERLLEDHPQDYELRLRYAQALLRLSQGDAALDQFERLLERRPDDAGVLYAAGLLALEAGDTGAARERFRRLLALGERRDQARFYLGRAAEAEGDHGQALEWYRQVSGQLRDDAQLRIASVLAAQDRLEDARQHLRNLRQNQPDLSVASFVVEGDLLRNAGRAEESFQVLSEGLERYPDNGDLRYSRAMTAIAMDRVQQAVDDLEYILERDPENAQVLNALGYTLVDSTERVDEGAELIQRAFELNPDDPAIIDSMGWAAYRQGRPEEALAYLRQAHEMIEDAEIAAHLGEVLWILGRRDEARAVWQDAVEASPDHPVLRRTMERLLP